MATVVEFGTRDAANEVREDYASALTGRFDRRHKRIEIADDVPDNTRVEIEDLATETRAEHGESLGSGQVELSRQEKRDLDFRETNVFHARSAKAAALDAGVTNWTDYYDPKLTVDENRTIFERAEGDRNIDTDERTEDEIQVAAASAQERARSEQVQQAIEYCREEHDEGACGFLREQGFTDEEVLQIMGEWPEDAPEDPPVEVPDGGEEIAEQNGITGEQYGALQALWRGYRANLAEARSKAAAINEIRREAGQDPIRFTALGDEYVTRAALQEDDLTSEQRRELSDEEITRIIEEPEDNERDEDPKEQPGWGALEADPGEQQSGLSSFGAGKTVSDRQGERESEQDRGSGSLLEDTRAEEEEREQRETRTLTLDQQRLGD